jgi:hypothetical protein
MSVFLRVEWTQLKKEYVKWKVESEVQGGYFRILEKMRGHLKKLNEETQFRKNSSIRIRGFRVECTKEEVEVQGLFSSHLSDTSKVLL